MNSEFSLEDNFEILRQAILDDDEAPENPKRTRFSNELRPIEEIPHPYQQVFAEYGGFNVIQSKILDDVFYSDDSLVVCAPTGSGKTAIFELAIVRLLIKIDKLKTPDLFKIVYICPMKALCEERLVDWHKKFSAFGINSISVTGDSDKFEFQNLFHHNLIITTPEKWDCLTRKWRDNTNFVQMIKLLMIDEIHLLGDENRGSTLEAVVCRMKTIEETLHLPKRKDAKHKIRLVAASATIANVEDVAEWLGKSSNVKYFKFSEDYRPVKLNKIVLGFPHTMYASHFKFDLALNYKLPSLIMQHSHGKPTLIFCSTRKIAEMTAKHLLQHLTLNLPPEQKRRLFEATGTISDANMKSTLVHGVGYHHAGMLPETRKVVEELFRNGELPILVTTCTLAVGVNLPAHLVVVKTTKLYTNSGFRDITETSLLQMVGRAGRPQYDTEATALILTTLSDKEKFERMIGGTEPIESTLHKHLTEHLNAEVVLQTITDLDVAMRWLSSTFLYIRARKNPKHYGLTSDAASIDQKLLEMCKIDLNKLISAGMMTIEHDVLLKTTPIGTAMAKYYLAFETMKLFTQTTGHEILQQILALIAKCSEFSEMYLRVNDKKCLNLLNKCSSGQTIRFPLNGKIKTLDMKINCIIQAVLGCLDIGEHSILSEAFKIMRNGLRIVNCLGEYLESEDHCFKALLSTITLAKCFHVKLWENSPYVSKQFPGIGPVLSSQLVKAGKTSFQLILESDPREIEMVINKKPPAGSKLLEQVKHLPKYVMGLNCLNRKTLQLIVTLENDDDLKEFCSLDANSLMVLLVGDSLNNILMHEKFSHSYMIENRTFTRSIPCQSGAEEVEAHFISENWVGIDANANFSLVSKPESAEPAASKKPSKKDNLTYMQKFMEIYMKEKNAKVVPTDTSKKINIQNNIQLVAPMQNVVERKETHGSDFNERTQDKNMQSSLGLNPTTHSTSNLDESFGCFSQKYKYAPKRFSHNSNTGTEVKPAKNQNKITWRSPLTYSPPVKFSPKIIYPATSNNDSLSCNVTYEALETLKRPSLVSPGTPSTPRLTQTNLRLPLSDKEHADSSVDESNDSRSTILEKIAEVVSTSFLESAGLLERKRSVQIKTSDQYYDQLMAQSDLKQRKFKCEEKFGKTTQNVSHGRGFDTKTSIQELVHSEVSEVANCSRSFQELSSEAKCGRYHPQSDTSRNLENSRQCDNLEQNSSNLEFDNSMDTWVMENVSPKSETENYDHGSEAFGRNSNVGMIPDGGGLFGANEQTSRQSIDRSRSVMLRQENNKSHLSCRSKSNQSGFSAASFDNMSDKVDFYSSDWQNLQDDFCASKPPDTPNRFIFRQNRNENQFLVQTKPDNSKRNVSNPFDDDVRQLRYSTAGRYARMDPNEYHQPERTTLREWSPPNREMIKFRNDCYGSRVRKYPLEYSRLMRVEHERRPSETITRPLEDDQEEEDVKPFMFESCNSSFSTRNDSFTEDDCNFRRPYNVGNPFPRHNYQYVSPQNYRRMQTSERDTRYIDSYRRREPYPRPTNRCDNMDGYQYLRGIMELEDNPRNYSCDPRNHCYAPRPLSERSYVPRSEFSINSYGQRPSEDCFTYTPLDEEYGSNNFSQFRGTPSPRDAFCLEGKNYIMSKFLNPDNQEN